MDKKAIEKIEKIRKQKKEAKNWIKVGMSTCGIAAGADKVFAKLNKEVESRGLAIDVKRCGCAGMCYAEPLVEVAVEGMPQVVYGGILEDNVRDLIDQHILKKELLNDHIYKVKVTKNGDEA